MFITNNDASFHLWGKESLVKYQKVSKCYDHNCRFLYSFIKDEEIIFKTENWCIDGTPCFLELAALR